MDADRILAIAGNKARHGEYFEVHRYQYRAESTRKLCERLCKQGKLKFAGLYGKYYAYWRPEDKDVFEKAIKRNEENMRKIYLKNIDWHLTQAEKCPVLADYHHKEADKCRVLAGVV